MKLVGTAQNNLLQGYTTVQSATAGWKEISCAKLMSTSSTTTATVRITIPSSNPLVLMSVFWNWSNPCDSANVWYWGTMWGFRCQTNGVCDNPTGNGAAGDQRWTETYYNGFSPGNFVQTPTITFGTRQIDFNSRTSDCTPVNWTHHLRVFSGRIDLVTLTCV